MQKNLPIDLYNLLVTRDFEPEILDKQGKAVTDPSEAEIFSFDWKTPNANYGTTVLLLGPDNQLQVYFGDNLGRSMAEEDKDQWYEFLNQVKEFAVRNLQNFETQNLNRLKYTMQGMAAIKEGLFEGYYGTRKVSYADQPKKTRLMIRHNRDLGEDDARHRAIESLFVETAEGERFKVPSRSLMHGRMLARHIAEGGTPYDAFGQHITQTVNEMHTLSRFIRASRNKDFHGSAADLIEQAVRHYQALKTKARKMISQRGYMQERQTFDPAEVRECERTVDTIRTMFIEQSLDSRIEEALPLLAKMAEQQNKMKEAEEFECWSRQITEGTWSLPDTPEQQKKLQDLMSQELIVGSDAMNATTQLYDLVGDDELFDILETLAMKDPDANAWDDPRVIARLAELGISKTQTPSAKPDAVDENLMGAPVGGGAGSLQPGLGESRFEPVKVAKAPKENSKIHEIPDAINFDMLPGSKNIEYPEKEYSETLYFKDPISNGTFSFYTAFGVPRIRSVNNSIPQTRMQEIAHNLQTQKTSEDLDTDGTMMTRPTNCSSESVSRDHLERLVELAKK